MSDLVLAWRGQLPADPSTFADIGAQDFSAVSEWSKGLDRAQRLVVGAWLIHRRMETAEGWGETLSGYAVSFERDVRTLQRWLAEAAEHFGVAAELPRAAREQRARPEKRKSRDTVSPATGPTWTGKPETVEDVRRLGNLVATVGAQGWARALTVDRIDTLIGVLKAARTEALRATAITTTASACTHPEYRPVLGGAFYECTACGAGLGNSKPSTGRRVA